MLSTDQFWSYIYDIIAVKMYSKLLLVFASNSKSGILSYDVVFKERNVKIWN